MHNRVVLVMLLVSACSESPPPSLEALPGCADLGCDPAAASKVCVTRGECLCGPREAQVSCAPTCAVLACESLSCGDLTPEGDTDPTACVCELEIGYVSCRG